MEYEFDDSFDREPAELEEEPGDPWLRRRESPAPGMTARTDELAAQHKQWRKTREARAAARPSNPARAPATPVLREADGASVSPRAAELVSRAEARAGQALPDELRKELEAALGRPLGGVRIHADTDAAAAARAVAANAYTLGRDIFFGAGKYDPASAKGRRLIAHEVAHTIQSPGQTSKRQLEVSEPGDRHEREADHFASAFADSAGRQSKAPRMPAVTPGSGGAAIKRDWPDGESEQQETPEQVPGSVNFRAYRADTPRFRAEMRIGIGQDSGEDRERGVEVDPEVSRGDPSVTAGATNGIGGWAAGISMSAVHSDLATLTVGNNLDFQVDMDLFEASISDSGLDVNLAVLWVSVNGYLRAADVDAVRAMGADSSALIAVLEAGNQIRFQGRIGVKLPASDLRHLVQMSEHFRTAEGALSEAAEHRQEARRLSNHVREGRRRLQESRDALSRARQAASRRTRGAAQARQRANQLQRQVRSQRAALTRNVARRNASRTAAAQAERRAASALRAAESARGGLSRPLGQAVGRRMTRSWLTRGGARLARGVLRVLGPIGVAWEVVELAQTLYDIGRGAMAFGPGVDGADEAADNPADSIEEGGEEDREDADGGTGNGRGGDSDTGTDDGPVEGGTEESGEGGGTPDADSQGGGQEPAPPSADQREAAPAPAPETEAAPEADAPEQATEGEQAPENDPDNPLGIGNPVTEAIREMRRQQYGAFLERAAQHSRDWYFEEARRGEGDQRTEYRRGERVRGILACHVGGQYVAGSTTIRILRVSDAGSPTRIRHRAFDASDAEGNLSRVPAGTLSRSQDEAPVQEKSRGKAGSPSSAATHDAADRATTGSSSALPYRAQIQRAFGRHDVSGISAFLGGATDSALDDMNAEAFARGETVALRAGASLHTVAHEAAHVVQQRRGVSVTGGVGRVGDRYERQADAIADRVVLGESAEDLIGAAAMQPARGDAVQKRTSKKLLDPMEYLRKHAKVIAFPLRLEINRMAERLGGLGAHLSWTSDGTVLADALRKPFDGDVLVEALGRYMKPEPLARWVQKGFVAVVKAPTPDDYAAPTGAGEDDYTPSVATSIANGLERSLRKCLKRVGPRYLAAKNQAQVKEWDRLGVCDPAVAPEPKPADVVSAHPFDTLLIREFCSGGVVDANLVAYQHEDADRLEIETHDPMDDPIEYEFTGYEGLNGWLRVHSVAKPMVEAVAKKLFGSTEKANLLIDSSPLFGFNADAIDEMGQVHQDKLEQQIVDIDPDLDRKEEQKQWDQNQQYGGWSGEIVGEERPPDPLEALQLPVDPQRSLLDSDLADEAALTQAGRAEKPGTNESIISQMRANLLVMKGIIDQAKKFGLGRSLGSARDRIDTQSRDLVNGDPRQIARWSAHATKQAETLRAVSVGLKMAHTQLGSMIDLKADPGAHGAGQAVRQPIRRIATLYVKAAEFSHLPKFAQQRLDEADLQSRLFPAEMMEHLLGTVQRAIHQAKGKNKKTGADNKAAYDTEGMAERELELRQRVAEVRSMIMDGDPRAGETMEVLVAEIQDLATEADMVANMDQLDGLWKALGDADSWMITVGTSKELKFLQRVSAYCLRKWNHIYSLWKGGRKKDAKEALTKFRTEDKDLLAELFSRAIKSIKSAQKQKLITTLAAIMVITVASMGAGSAVAGFVGAGGLGWSAGATAIAATAAEATVTTGLMALIQDDPTFADMGVDFVANFAMFGALHKYAKGMQAAGLVARAEAGGAVGMAAKGTMLAGEGLIIGAMGIAQEEVKKRLDGGTLTNAEMKQIATESVAMWVGFSILGRKLSPMLKRIEGVGRGFGGRAKALASSFRASRVKAATIKKTKSADDAAKLLKTDRKLLEDEVALYRDLLADPKALRQAGLTKKQVAALQKDLDGVATKLFETELALNTKEIGADHYQAPRDLIPDILRRHQDGSPDAKITTIDADIVTGLKTHKVEFADGRVLKITETPSAREIAPLEVPTSKQAKAMERYAARAREIQANRDRQLGELIAKSSDPTFEHITIGAGQAGTINHATLKGAKGKGAAPGADVKELPNSINIAPEGTLFGKHRGFELGQGHAGIDTGGTTVRPREMSTDKGFAEAEHLDDSLLLSQFESGQATYRKTVDNYRYVPGDDFPHQVKIGDKWLRTKSIDFGGGLGKPNKLGNAKHNKLSETAETSLRGDKLIVDAAESLTLPNANKKDVVVVVGDGPTAAWAVEAAIRSGAKKVVWVSRTPKPGTERGSLTADVDPDTVTALKKIGLSEKEIASFSKAYNDRNKKTFKFTKDKLLRKAKVELRYDFQDARKLDASAGADAGRLEVQIGGRKIRADGIVSAIGQTVHLPGGMTPKDLALRPVIKEGPDKVKMLVALEGFDAKTGEPTGIRIVGAQRWAKGIADYVPTRSPDGKNYRKLYQEHLKAAENKLYPVHDEAKGVPGSINETGIAGPLAN